MSLSSELKVNAIVKNYDPEDHLATWRVKSGLAKMLKGGVIMDVIDPAQARVAEDAGAVAVMALERVPSDIRHSCVPRRRSRPPRVHSRLRPDQRTSRPHPTAAASRACRTPT